MEFFLQYYTCYIKCNWINIVGWLVSICSSWLCFFAFSSFVLCHVLHGDIWPDMQLTVSICWFQKWAKLSLVFELWLSRLEGSPAYECPLSLGDLPTAFLFMKSVFVTNSKSWAMEYHNLIMGCHPTAQIHYSQWIYEDRSQHCHLDVTDVLGIFTLRHDLNLSGQWQE